MDRRAARTKAMIRRAFLKEREEHTIDKITVTGLCRSCDLNRTTFYLHYPDVYAIQEEMEQDVLDTITGLQGEFLCGETENDAIMERMLSLIYENRRVLKVLLLSSTERFWQRVRGALHQLYRDSVREKYYPDGEIPAEQQQILLFLLHGFLGVYREWIMDGCRADREQLKHILIRASEPFFEDLTPAS